MIVNLSRDVTYLKKIGCAGELDALILSLTAWLLMGWSDGTGWLGMIWGGASVILTLHVFLSDGDLLGLWSKQKGKHVYS